MKFGTNSLERLSSYEASSSSFRTQQANKRIPHRGSLCRVEGEGEHEAMHYSIEILLEDGTTTHNLRFLRRDFDFSIRLFAIMDTESKGQVSQATVKEFVTLRCPVFWRRDEDLQSCESTDSGSSPTFNEVWTAVVTCSIPQIESERLAQKDLEAFELGVEGWMVFCRFIALAQYLEAKRRFLFRHLQQTMRHRNAPRGSEMVVVDVPPLAPPVPLSPSQLALYERENSKCLPLPELDLDHSLLAAHDVLRRRKCVGHQQQGGSVEINVFGSSSSMNSSGSSSQLLDFCLTYSRNVHQGEHSMSSSDTIAVRRSMDDMKWLNDTFKSHKILGGTLCGRILPPFPGGNGRIHASQFPSDDTSMSTPGGAIAAAAVGVGMIKQGIKSLWGSYRYVSTSTSTLSSPSQPSDKRIMTSSSSSSLPSKATKKGSNSVTCALPESYYNPNSPAGKARQLERYLNYLLEHPALSTSFPLNTILKASQSGLEAAKQSLEEHTRQAKEIKEQTPKLDDGKLLTFWPLHGPGSTSSPLQPNMSWVRTAAQAAMALKVHGILETTGLPSASARLQHASLPNFDNSWNPAWTTDDEGEPSHNRIRQVEEECVVAAIDPEVGNSFEEGVLHVQDELDSAEDTLVNDNMGYDLLPLPVPAPERRILSVGGNDALNANATSSEPREARFRYGSPTLRARMQLEHQYDDESSLAYLGDIAVDENIDKLREVIGSVDNTLSRCLASSGGIGRSRRELLALHMQIIRGFDSFEGLQGQFVSQRALLKGVSGLEQSRDVFEESDLAFIDDVSWQTALANSAVSAAEDVRSTVRAARTAANAKAAASSAAFAAQNACESVKFSSIDEARAAQTRASIARSHAIHAAVVEHEANTVKRRATLALAHDVKCWNVHRKREILKTCLAYARSQHEATRRAVDAWSCLRDGYVGSTMIPSTQARKSAPAPSKIQARVDDATAEIYSDVGNNYGEGGKPVIVVQEHELLKQLTDDLGVSTGGEIISDPEPESILPLVLADPIPEEEDEGDGTRLDADEVTADLICPQGGSETVSDPQGATNFSTSMELQMATANQATEVDIFSHLSASSSESTHGMNTNLVQGTKSTESQAMDSKKFSQGFDLGQTSHTMISSQSYKRITSSPTSQEYSSSKASVVVASSHSSGGFNINGTNRSKRKVDLEDDEALTSSMQSLVDGLMNWGGQYDSEEDFALPTGMAASIAFEESGVLS